MLRAISIAQAIDNAKCKGSSTFSVNPNRNNGFSLMGTYELGEKSTGNM
jgi:hypothetical protein